MVSLKYGVPHVSCKAYGCEYYILSEEKETEKCPSICGKSRIAPLHENTLIVPSLEIQVTVLATIKK